MAIDTSFDFRTDSFGKNADPDAVSPTLRRYHQLLWSKSLPGGSMFDLSINTPGVYLHHQSAVGEFFLSSDTVIPTFTLWPAMKPITGQLTESENEAFRTIQYTIGGMMVWPGNRIDSMPTINQARGLHPRIKDRMDLTLECFRRHYLGQVSPLTAALARYNDFFALFEDFSGYVTFFLLQDMLADDQRAVDFFMPFGDFKTPAVPKDVDAYRSYRQRSIDFIEARNQRIDQLATT